MLVNTTIWLKYTNLLGKKKEIENLDIPITKEEIPEPDGFTGNIKVPELELSICTLSEVTEV